MQARPSSLWRTLSLRSVSFIVAIYHNLSDWEEPAAEHNEERSVSLNARISLPDLLLCVLRQGLASTQTPGIVNKLYLVKSNNHVIRLNLGLVIRHVSFGTDTERLMPCIQMAKQKSSRITNWPEYLSQSLLYIKSHKVAPQGITIPLVHCLWFIVSFQLSELSREGLFKNSHGFPLLGRLYPLVMMMIHFPRHGQNSSSKI